MPTSLEVLDAVASVADLVMTVKVFPALASDIPPLDLSSVLLLIRQPLCNIWTSLYILALDL